MSFRPSVPHKDQPRRRDHLRLVLLVLLIAVLSAPPIAAGASGTVSVSIRLEVGIADLQRAPTSGGLDGPASTTRAFDEFAYRLRESLEGRYHPAEVDRIVDEVTDHAVIVVDGEAIGRSASDSAFFNAGDGTIVSL